MSTVNPLAMSDEEFLKSGLSPESMDPPAEQEAQTDESTAAGADVVDSSAGDVQEPDASAGSAADADATEPVAEIPEADKPAQEAAPAEPVQNPPDPTAKAEPDAEKKDVKTEPAPVDYEAFYKTVMAPFKANGRMVEPKTPEEAIRLMQMGAGYGRKLQDMQPHLKSLRMLEKHDLLDEGKLSFLIDLHNKNPDAIKKLIAESGIDPLDVNTEDDAKYVPQNHAVSDEEVAFHEALAEVQAQPNGHETLNIINQTWDSQSKAVLWQTPALLNVIQSQRENGIYDLIVAEIDRQKIFGSIPMNAPFLEAYKTAGDTLQNAGVFARMLQKSNVQPEAVRANAARPAPQVITTRTDAPKRVVANSDKAQAAAPAPVTAKRAAPVINPLNMADDEFLKHFAGRL